MREIRALFWDTLREARLRAVFWGFYALSTAMILFFLVLLRVDVVEGARATITVFGESGEVIPVQRVLRGFFGAVAAFLYTWGMAIAVFAAAGLVAAAFETGRIEWLLSKPLARWKILAARLAGSVAAVGVNVAYLVCGVWLILSWKTGVWDASFLVSIPAAVFMFTVLLSVAALVVVWFESATLATMVTFALMLLSPILAQHRLMVKLLDSEFWRRLWRGAYYVLPKVYDVGRMNLDLVRDRAVENWMPVWSSALFAAVVLAAAFYSLSRKNF